MGQLQASMTVAFIAQAGDGDSDCAMEGRRPATASATAPAGSRIDLISSPRFDAADRAAGMGTRLARKLRAEAAPCQDRRVIIETGVAMGHLEHYPEDVNVGVAERGVSVTLG